MSDFNDEYDNEYDNVVDSIADIEDIRMPSDKQNGNCYIGTYVLGTLCGKSVMVMDVSVTSKTFFEYDFIDIKNYLFYYYYSPRHRYMKRTIEIMKLCIENNGIYRVVLKTFWLRIIQRIWRRYYSNLRSRGNIHIQRIFEMRGKWGEHKNINRPLYLSTRVLLP